MSSGNGGIGESRACVMLYYIRIISVTSAGQVMATTLVTSGNGGVGESVIFNAYVLFTLCYIYSIVNSTLSKSRKRRVRCKNCLGCQSAACGTCKYCSNPKLKRPCIQTKCTNLQ